VSLLEEQTLKLSYLCLPPRTSHHPSAAKGQRGEKTMVFLTTAPILEIWSREGKKWKKEDEQGSPFCFGPLPPFLIPYGLNKVQIETNHQKKKRDLEGFCLE
jgi:hypothetical protein